MPQSDINKVTFFQEYYLGDPPPFFAGFENEQSSASTIQVSGIPDFSGYPYVHNIPSTPPHPDSVLTTVKLETQSGSDSNGIQYGGNFRPNADDIIITGNLSDSEKMAVRNALTINEGNLSNNIVTDEYIVNTFGLAGIGIKDFGYIIPYSEQDIFIPGDTIEIPFFRLTNNGTPRDTRITLSSVSPRQLTIDDGIDAVLENAMIVENISPSGQRDFNILNVQVTSTDFIINYSEITNNKLIFKIEPKLSLLPLSYTMDSNVLLIFDSSIVQEMTMEFDIEFDSILGITKRVFKIRPYRRPSVKPGEDFSGVFRPKYARVTFGTGVGGSFVRSGNNCTYSIYTYVPSEFGRRTFNAMTFFNTSLLPIEFELNKSLKTIRIRGENSLGNTVSRIFNIEDYSTLNDLALAVNSWSISIQGWNGNVGLNILDLSLNGSVSPLYLDNVSNVFVNNAIALSFTSPAISSGDPNYTWTVDLSGKSLNYAFDFKERFKEKFGYSIGLPISSPNFGLNNNTWMPMSWRELSGLALAVRSISIPAQNGAAPTMVFEGFDINENSTDPNFYLYYYEDNSNISFSSFDTVGDLCNFFNTNTPHILASPGLFYENLNISSVIPESGTWRRSGRTIAEIPESSSIVASKIQIKGAQENIGGSNNFPSIDFVDNFSTNISTSNNNISQLSSIVSNRYPGIISASPLNGHGSVSVNNISTFPPKSIIYFGDNAILEAGIDRQIIFTYGLDNFGTIESLVSSINQDWNARDIVATTVTGTQNRPDAIPSNLISIDVLQDLTVSDVVFTGNVSAISPPSVPEKFIYLDYNLNWVNGSGPNIDTQGIQVALGGYKSKGKYFINQGANAFFEPGFNSLFGVTFNVMEAEEVYILVRTRQDIDATSYTSNAEDYQGLVRYSNGYPSLVTNANILTGSPFDMWENDDWNSGNIPASFVIPAQSNIMTLFADDISILDSLQVRINNFPAELDEFSFLALNRTNLNASMTESRQGRVFGMVLDNRGIWDVLIGPESEIRRVIDGEFDYLNFSFDHNPLDSDEAYNFDFFNTDDLDPSVLASIDLIPVPGFPKVAVLRIESGIKKYLSKLRSSAPANSLDGCSINIDILAEGRESGSQGIARVTIFADPTCVFDVGLCDFFWNLSNPPEPAKKDSIENTLVISYQDYIDCQRLDINGNGDNAKLSFPLLITIEGVPMFENGNALLLIKGTYSASVEGYFFPSKSQFSTIQNPECGDLGDNAPLSDRLNQELVFIEGEEEPITDPIRISQIINGSEPYLYIKPRFQFPGVDSEFECGPNEIVIASIGYQFQDWDPGLRQDDILIGIDAIISNSTFSAPELEFCYKYYYRREN